VQVNWVQVAKWVAGIAVAVVGIALAAPWAAKPPPKGLVVEAHVVRFGNNASRWRPDLIWVVASTPDGRTGEGAISIDELNRLGCKVGDPVKARVAGPGLVVDATSCGKAQ
jgi:hypothetical protein